MRHTAADQNRFIVPDRVRPYVVDEEGRFANAPYVDNSYKWAGGGFVSTAEDLVRFGLAHAGPGIPPGRDPGDAPDARRRPTTARSTDYGIGWRGRHGRAGAGGAWDTEGDPSADRTIFWIYPDQGLVIAMVTNLSDGPDFPLDEIVDAFVD